MKHKILSILRASALNESDIPGLSTAKKAHKESGVQNKEAQSDIKKKFDDYDKASKQMDANAIKPVKRNLSDEEEMLRDMVEKSGGMEDLVYDGEVDDTFKKRQEMAIKGDSRTGNGTDDKSMEEFGKKFIEKTKKRKEFNDKIAVTGVQLGDDFEVMDTPKEASKRKVAVEGVQAIKKAIMEGKIERNKYNKGDKVELTDGSVRTIKKVSGYIPKDGDNTYIYRFEETGDIGSLERDIVGKVEDEYIDLNESDTVRLRFKKPFNGLSNVVKLIPESYKVNKNVFEMFDGNELYKIRWEGDKKNGVPVTLLAKDSKAVNEEISKMKKMFDYKIGSNMTPTKSGSKINENEKFCDIYNKSKVMMKESLEKARINETLKFYGLVSEDLSLSKELLGKKIAGKTGMDINEAIEEAGLLLNNK